MPPLNLDATILGRPIKPVSLGLMILCMILVATNVTNMDSLTTGALRHFVAAFAAATVVVLFLGWYRTSQRLAEYALLMVFALHFTRGVFILLTVGWQVQNGWQSLAVCVIAAGSFFLERSDSRCSPSTRKGA